MPAADSLPLIKTPPAADLASLALAFQALGSTKPTPPGFWQSCDARGWLNGSTLALCAARLGRVDVLSAIWERCDPNALDTHLGRDALMVAIDWRQNKAARFLSSRCDAKRRDSEGSTALFLAIRRFSLDLIPELIPRSDPSDVNKAGDSAFAVLRSIVEEEGVAGQDVVNCLDLLAAARPEDPSVLDFRAKAPRIALPRHDAWLERAHLSEVVAGQATLGPESTSVERLNSARRI